MMNIFNGGAHADNSVDFQEFMAMPIGAPNFHEALRMGVEVFHNLKSVLKKRGYSTAVGDEGGFAPNLKSNEEAIESFWKPSPRRATRPVSKSLSRSTLPRANSTTPARIRFQEVRQSERSSEQMVEFWESWVRQYPIVSHRGWHGGEDWDGWKLLTQKLGKQIQLVGDDIFVTNPKIFARGIAEGIGNAILIKLNQIGTRHRNLEAIEMARQSRLRLDRLASLRRNRRHFHRRFRRRHGLRPDQDRLRLRTDRIAKYNQLLRIEEALGSAARFQGRKALAVQ